MIFDPFGDFKSRGYLRNTAGLHDVTAVKEFEHRAFRQNLQAAVEHLSQIEQITYLDVLATHRILFQDVYPWAGKDRQTTANLSDVRGLGPESASEPCEEPPQPRERR